MSCTPGEAPCSAVHSWAQISTAKSVAKLTEKNANSNGEYIWNLVVAYRALQLTKDPTRAASLLRLIPSNESDQLAIMTLGDSLCDAESVTDMQKLAAVRDGLPSEFAKAVILAPSFLYRYIRYSIVACQDAQRLCDAHAKSLRAQSKQVCGNLEAIARGGAAAIPCARV
jgi:hypothetical protein